MSAVASRRPSLDVLRVLAILLVLVQHVTATRSANFGLVGVLVFFGLSGFLITDLLATELETARRVRLGRFYLRRAARLAPGLVTMVALSWAALAAVGAAPSAWSALTTVGYVKNYALVAAGPTHPDFVWGHTWSLAVEEHFYLLWPLVLAVLWRRLGPRARVAAVLLCCAGAWLLRFVALRAGVSDATLYYDSAAHVDVLLYGAAAALALRAGWRPWWGLAPGGALLLVLAGAAVGPFDDTVWSPAVVGVGTALVIAAGAPALDRSFRSPVWRWCADRSYSVYLWHLPAIAVTLQVLGGLGWPVRVLAVLVSIPVACASYRWVEQPVRVRVNAWSIRRRTPATPATPATAAAPQPV